MKARLFVLALPALLAAQTAPAPIPGARAAAVFPRITANSLRGHVSFLASDLLEGRATPSRGLDIAAEYIAAQFRRAGLKPVSGDSYFQTAEMLALRQPRDGFELRLDGVAADPARTRFSSVRSVELRDAPVLKLTTAPKESEIAGKVLLIEYALLRRWPASVDRSKAALTIVVAKSAGEKEAPRPGELRRVGDPRPAAPPTVAIFDPAWVERFAALPEGETAARVTATVPAQVEERVRVHNVAGILPGGDPALRGEYVILTAHYDHVGVRWGHPDPIFNGANDDASGTVGLIEVAGALAALKPAPRRSVLFLAVFGEENDLFGSRHYAQHPLVPLDKTVAAIALEHLGRSDDSEGPQRASASFTGWTFSDLPGLLARGARAARVRIAPRAVLSDEFFRRSDNYAFAQAGIPAHTLVVAVDFPDYHEAGDEWPKLDYDNMAVVCRGLAAGLVGIADRRTPPQWSSDPKTEPYRKARAARIPVAMAP